MQKAFRQMSGLPSPGPQGLQGLKAWASMCFPSCPSDPSGCRWLRTSVPCGSISKPRPASPLVVVLHWAFPCMEARLPSLQEHHSPASLSPQMGFGKWGSHGHGGGRTPEQPGPIGRGPGTQIWKQESPVSKTRSHCEKDILSLDSEFASES